MVIVDGVSDDESGTATVSLMPLNCIADVLLNVSEGSVDVVYAVPVPARTPLWPSPDASIMVVPVPPAPSAH